MSCYCLVRLISLIKIHTNKQTKVSIIIIIILSQIRRGLLKIEGKKLTYF